MPGKTNLRECTLAGRTVFKEESTDSPTIACKLPLPHGAGSATQRVPEGLHRLRCRLLGPKPTELHHGLCKGLTVGTITGLALDREASQTRLSLPGGRKTAVTEWTESTAWERFLRPGLQVLQYYSFHSGFLSERPLDPSKTGFRFRKADGAYCCQPRPVA